MKKSTKVGLYAACSLIGLKVIDTINSMFHEWVVNEIEAATYDYFSDHTEQLRQHDDEITELWLRHPDAKEMFGDMVVEDVSPYPMDDVAGYTSYAPKTYAPGPGSEIMHRQFCHDKTECQFPDAIENCPYDWTTIKTFQQETPEGHLITEGSWENLITPQEDHYGPMDHINDLEFVGSNVAVVVQQDRTNDELKVQQIAESEGTSTRHLLHQHRLCFQAQRSITAGWAYVDGASAGCAIHPDEPERCPMSF